MEGRHAACVNIVAGITSVYRWKGEIEKDGESLLVIKCPADGFETLQSALLEAHPYEVTEVLALPVEKGNPPYLEWIRAECTS